MSVDNVIKDKGLAVKPGNTSEFISAIRHLADNPDLRATFGINARIYAESFLNYESIMKKFYVELEAMLVKQRHTHNIAPKT
mgnify:CR=1 FL=1